jgi:hypothetical protein
MSPSRLLLSSGPMGKSVVVYINGDIVRKMRAVTVERDGRAGVADEHRPGGHSMPNALSIFRAPPNLGMKERAISVAAGLGLAAAATKPRPNPLLNVAALLGGAYLAIRGATGRCPVKQALQSLSGGAAREAARTPVRRSRAARRTAPTPPAQ